MEEAENITKKNNIEGIWVISGVGVRKYYSLKLGYGLQAGYMFKKINP